MRQIYYKYNPAARFSVVFSDKYKNKIRKNFPTTLKNFMHLNENSIKTASSIGVIEEGATTWLIVV